MKQLTLAEARKLVPAPKHKRKVINSEGITQDIISAILANYKRTRGQTVRLATQLKRDTPEDTLFAVWHFVRTQIAYRLDPFGKQYIKDPARTVYDGFSDCKGYSLLICSLLSDLGIKNAFRFVSYGAHKTVTHVYSLGFVQGRTYVLDACMPGFNQEKAYTHNEDHMTQIIEISGIGEEVAPLHISGFESEAELDLKIMGQRAELEAIIAAEVAGIGSAIHKEHEEAAQDYRLAIAALDGDNPEEAIAGIADAIGRRKKKGGLLKKVFKRSPQKKEARKKKRTARKERRKKFLKKVGTKIKNTAKKAGNVAKKLGKGVLKVATFPQRMFVKALAEVFIPRMAPMFLYLFITNRDTLNSLPANVKRKRAKAEKFARFMTKVIGMKEKHFMGLVRNGIMRKFKRSPEQILTASMKGRPINGIGVAYGAAAAQAAPAIVQVLEKLASLFGKKPSEDEKLGADDAPDPENDFADATPKQKRQVLANMKTKSFAERGQEPGEPEEEIQMRQRAEVVQNKVVTEPEETSVEEPLPEAEENFKAGSSTPARGARSGNRRAAPSGEPQEQAESTSSGKSNTGLLVGGGLLLAAVAVASGSTSKRGKK